MGLVSVHWDLEIKSYVQNVCLLVLCNCLAILCVCPCPCVWKGGSSLSIFSGTVKVIPTDIVLISLSPQGQNEASGPTYTVGLQMSHFYFF